MTKTFLGGTVAALVMVSLAQASLGAEGQTVWEDGKAVARLVLAEPAGPAASLAERTINRYLGEQFGWTLPTADRADAPGLYMVVGRDPTHPILAGLAQEGADLRTADLGDEGFRIVTHAAGGRRAVIVLAATPVGLKHGCQELVFFHLAATGRRAAVDWPMRLSMRPQLAYRGVYMLPCWSQHDTIASWRRVLEFNSELTLNRIWFWLNGFPLLPEYGGEYAGTDLAKVENMRGLVELCRREQMRFYVGGGWFTWHHEKIANGSIDRGVQYYVDMARLLPGAEGIYLEPAGEGNEVAQTVWQSRTDAFRRLANTIWKDRPDFEFAVAIGKFNAKEYRKAMHAIDQKRLYWWWCWGDPLVQEALQEHPLVLRWHTNVRMSDYHGSTEPPQAREAVLSGVATSYDPGQGFGNRWNGYATLGGAPRARDFHPHTLPYFAQQYWFRERCWNLGLSKEDFSRRLGRRLLDAEAPAELIGYYLTLCDLCGKPQQAREDVLRPIEALIAAHANSGTPRHRDTLARMREAIAGLRKVRGQVK
jgi:hypothetical protein